MNKNKSFETSLNQLQVIIEKLESGTPTLNEMMKLFEEGMQLTNICQEQLSEVEERIATLVKDENGFKEIPGIGSS